MTWLRLVFGAAFCLSLPTLAQADSADDGNYAECAELLGSPPFDRLLTQKDEFSGKEGNDYVNLNSDGLGTALLGVVCSRDQILDYFLSAGWEFLGEDFIVGESGPPANVLNRTIQLLFARCEACHGVCYFTAARQLRALASLKGMSPIYTPDLDCRR